jgi:biotin operon repressor
MDKGKLKRQIEILAMCLPDKRERIDVADLSMKFGTGEATINRDLSDLRNKGIDIHSTAGEGITITGVISSEIIKDLINTFIGQFYSDNLESIISKQIGIVDTRLFFERFVLLSMAVKEGIKTEIKIKNHNTPFIAEPVYIKLVKNDWVIIIISGDEFVHYKINEIEQVKNKSGAVRKFDRKDLEKYIEQITKPEIEARYLIKLQFATRLNGKFPKHIIHTIISEEETNGCIVLKGECNSLEELAKWIISNGDITKEILEPRPLVDLVLNKARQILDRYQERHMLAESETLLYNFDNVMVSESRSEFFAKQIQKSTLNIPEEVKKHVLKFYTPSQKDFWEYPYSIEF